MRKRAQALIMVLIMFLMTVASPLLNVEVQAAEEELKIQFHYLREDGNYDGWNIAAWDGASNCEFQKDDNGYVTDESGAVAESTVTAGSTEIGFIVRYSTSDNEWADREWIDENQSTGDRKVNVDGYISGTIHVYVVSQDFEYGTVVNYDEAVEGEYVAPEHDGLVINFYIDKKKTDDNWGLWLWDDVGTAAIYPLFEANEEGKLTISYNVKSNAGWVGFIVRDDNWTKDPDGDRIVDVSRFVDGSIDVYLESGNAEFDIDTANAIKGAKITSAVYDANTIVVKTSMAVENPAEAFTVICEDAEVAIKEVKATTETEYVLTFESDLDLTKAYNVVFNENTYEVSMPSLYKTEEFINEYTYTGDDLGATWTKEKTTFKVWAPLASEVKVNLYDNGQAGKGTKTNEVAMEKAENGVWVAEVTGDLNGTYYTYSVNNAGTVSEACDPYATTTGVNGDRAMVIDLDSTDPEGWESDKNPNADIGPDTFTDAVIYELHVRDASIDASSGVSEVNKGNFLGLTEHGENTILDHMVDLGITHLHLLPVYDFSSVNEETDGHNWGYDPKNYNVPEGSYSSDPYNGEVRVKEMKEMVQTLHENGISVVMDVVYNHVADAGNFCFNKIVPEYFSRMMENGGYSSNSGCGNDTASEHVMVRKYIVDSVKYWADEYHIDGFRFDLVGLLDTVTINEIMKEVWSDHPDVIFYGEGWEMNSYDTGVSMTIQNNADEVPGFAFFNDTIRDTIKGSVWDNGPGYVGGKTGVESTIESSFMGASVWGSEQTVCPTPLQTINYTSCHDNNTLIDRIMMSTPDETWENHIKMNNLAAAITITSQGVPFIHAAEDFLRSKPLGDGTYDHNSYASGDAINSIKWNELEDELHKDTYEYYKGLIAFRKDHAALRMTDAADVSASITALDGLEANVTAFEINGESANDDDLFVVFNPNKESTTVALPEGEWEVYVNGEEAGTEVLDTVDTEVSVEAISAMVLVKAEAEDEPSTDEPSTDEPGTDKPSTDAPSTDKPAEEAFSGTVSGENVPDGAKLNVEKLDLNAEETKALLEKVKKKHKSFMEKVKIETVLDLSLVKDGAEVRPDGTITVTLKLPAELVGKKLGIIYIAENGKITEMPSTVKGSYIAFTTDHFSNYAIYSYETASSPKTGDNSNAVTWMLIMMFGAVASAYTVKNKKMA
uniref:type I pullulanase n=1 Tax=Agathobacter sp. TaxID=2021311 RepID=UPI004055F8D4